MRRIFAICALVICTVSADAQITVWSQGRAVFDSKDQQVDSVSFQRISKAGANNSNESLGYKEVKPAYSASDYTGFCNVILGTATEGQTAFVPGVSDSNFRWVEIYDHTGKLIESTEEWTGVYRVPHGGWIIPFYRNATYSVYQKITVGTLDRLKVAFAISKSNFYIE